jgi:DNA polymerase-3 subunit epsilon
MTLLVGHDKSTKHRRAEELMEEGHEIKIVGESEFMTLVSSKSGR